MNKLGGVESYSYDDNAEQTNKITAPNIDSNRLLSSEIKKANEMVPTLDTVHTALGPHILTVHTSYIYILQK